MSAKILENIRVLDIADEKGVLCGKLMADMGAEVIKVEAPGGDATRKVGPFYENGNEKESLFSAFYNAGKKSIVLDITADDKDTFISLVKTADVLIETSKPGFMEKAGLSYDVLKKINPALVMCSITAFGHSGPWALWEAPSDMITYAAAGAMYEMGEADRPPIQLGYNLLSNGTCFYALTGIMAALVSRENTGLGDYVDISQFEIAGAWRGSELGFLQQAPDYKISQRKGSQGIMVPANFYKCKDGYAFMMASGRWPDVTAWLKDEGIDLKGKDDPKYLADQGFNKYLWAEIDEVNAMINELSGRYSMTEFMEEAQKRRIPVGSCETVKTILESRQFNARNYFTEIESPIFGKAKYPGKAIGFTAGGMNTSGPAPLPGADTQDILAGIDKAKAKSFGSEKRPAKPLEGVIVLDMGWVVAGPHGGRLLRELGATVIRIESATRLDPMRIDARRYGLTEKDSLEEGGWCFQENNRSKLDLCLNMKSPKAKEIFFEIVKRADIVCCNFAAAAFNRMGLSFENLSKYKKDIICLNASGLGNDGPYSTYATFAPVLSCMTGLTSLIGYEGEAPYGYPGILPDYMGGVCLAAAAVTALYYRNKTGKGQFVDLSQSEALMQSMGPALLDCQLNGTVPECIGNHHYLHQMAPHNCYECAAENTWIVIAVENDEKWKRFVKEFSSGYPLIAQEKYKTLSGRLENEAELDALIAALCKDHDAAALAQRLQSAGIAAAKANSTYDLLYDNPHAKETEYFRRIDLKDNGLEPDHFMITGPLINMASVSKEEYKPGPACGRDNDLILRDMFGFDDKTIKEAFEDKAFI